MLSALAVFISNEVLHDHTMSIKKSNKFQDNLNKLRYYVNKKDA